MAIADRRQIEVLDREEGMRLLDERARQYLNMSGEEFMRRWDAGEFTKGPERSEVVLLAMLLPLAR
jgi:hypothetical protein